MDECLLLENCLVPEKARKCSLGRSIFETSRVTWLILHYKINVTLSFAISQISGLRRSLLISISNYGIYRVIGNDFVTGLLVYTWRANHIIQF